LGFRDADGSGGGASADLFTGCTARSIFVMRLEALTGGDELGAGRFGVSAGFGFGSRILARGGFGASTRAGSCSTLDGITGEEVTFGLGLASVALAGELGSVTSSDVKTGMWSDSDEMVMALDTGGMRACGLRLFLASAVFAHSGVFLAGGDSSPSTGLEALHSPGRRATFCLFGDRPSASSFSFSFSFLASYGDFMGCALPTGPFGVPSRVLSDL
jgi:hypothetical protein